LHYALRSRIGRHRPSISEDVAAGFSFGTDADRCSMTIEIAGAPFVPEDESPVSFITEHYWGCAAQKNGSCIEYEVQHPRWRVTVFKGRRILNTHP
jgi:hypothetical protein